MKSKQEINMLIIISPCKAHFVEQIYYLLLVKSVGQLLAADLPPKNTNNVLI